MTGLDYAKAAARDAGRAGGGWTPGNGKPSTTVEEVQRIVLGPGARNCRHCPDYFVTDGGEARPLPIHLCPTCRRNVEEEAGLNSLPVTLGDDELTTALATIARLESRIVKAARPRRIHRLEQQARALRRQLWEKAESRRATA